MNARPIKRVRGIGRAPGVPPAGFRRHVRVGDLTPPGFVPVFQGWNVWDVWQADDPDTSILGAIWTAGESPERLLRVWVEDQLRDNAPGAAVADPANPAALSGAQVQPIPSVKTVPVSGPDGLSVAATRADIPELAGAMQLGVNDSKATLHTVRFYNRGSVTTMPWPHDQNFLVDRAYTPSPSNPVTGSPQPSSLAGGASNALDAAKSVVTVVAVGAGLVLGVVLITSLVNSSRKAAA